MTTVLIIDDEPLARSVVAEYLQHHADFALLQECSDGFEGVKAIHQHQPDLIFLDVNMPVLDGWQFLDELSKIDLPANFKIYMLSSSADMADMSQVAKYPVVQKYLLKPISLNLLSEVS